MMVTPIKVFHDELQFLVWLCNDSRKEAPVAIIFKPIVEWIYELDNYYKKKVNRALCESN